MLKFRKHETFSILPVCLKTPIHAPKIGVLVFHLQNEEQYQRNPQKAYPCASPRRLSHQA